MTSIRDAAAWTVTPVQPGDQSGWQALYRGYGAFYEEPMPADKLDLVWGWLHDPQQPMHGVVARSAQSTRLVGLAHFRPFHRPLHGSIGCFLDDLFVEPAVRGSGVVDALLAAVQRIAGQQGWDVVRWITRASNARARSAYHRLATETDLVTYDLPVPTVSKSQES